MIHTLYSKQNRSVKASRRRPEVSEGDVPIINP